MDQSATYDFLLTIVTMGLSRIVSKTDGDFSRKLQNFPIPMYVAPAVGDGFPLELGIGAEVRKTGMMGLPDGPKGLKIDLAI